ESSQLRGRWHLLFRRALNTPTAGRPPGGEAGRSRIAPTPLECVRLAAAFAPCHWLLSHAREQWPPCPPFGSLVPLGRPGPRARSESGGKPSDQKAPTPKGRASAPRHGAKAAASGRTPKSLACSQQSWRGKRGLPCRKWRNLS